jgi:hypothetical protein
MSVLLALGGIACIDFGHRLFRDGSGLANAMDKIEWTSEQTKILAAGMSVGSVLMLTSVGWRYFANNSIPKLELAVRGPMRRSSTGSAFQSYMPPRRR